MNYLKMLIKKRSLIATVFVIVTAVSAFLSFSFNKYKAQSIIEVGYQKNIDSILDKNYSDPREILEAPLQIVEKTQSGIYDDALMKELKIQKAELPELNASNPNNTNLVKLTVLSNSQELAQKTLEIVDRLIVEEHAKRAEILGKTNGTFQPTEVVKEPTTTKDGLGHILKIVAGGIAGLLLGILMAFFSEWWQANKKKLRL